MISAQTRLSLSTATDLDNLISLLQDPDILEELESRDETETNIGFIPTFGGEDAAGVGEGWEVLSWDATRILYLHVGYDMEGRQVGLTVRERATAEQETD